MARRRKSQNIKPLLYVEWDDHHANASWQEKVDHSPAHCVSVGWLIQEDKKAITIAGNRCIETSTVGNTQYILKSDITYRRKRARS